MRLFFFLAAGLGAAYSASIPKQVTFHRDVAPVLQKNCQGCHRPGEAAPMSLLTYKEVRPLAKAVKEAVLTKRMPPWFADPHAGKFANDSSLTPAEIETLVRWADSGAKEGDSKDAPKPVQFVQGWNIGRPDLVAGIPKPFAVQAQGTIDYTYFVLPLNLTEDTWISGAEVRPGNREVVHHVIAFVRPPGSKWLKDAPLGEPYLPKAGEGGTPIGQWVSAYAPGMPPDQALPGQGRLVKAGSDVVLQMHYTANGKAATDQTRIGFVFAKEPVKERVVTLASQNDKFVIPPGAPDYEVKSTITLREDSKLVTLLPHMHLRGKAFEMRAVYPSGETEVLLNVPRYDFNWQLIYRPTEQKLLPKGTKIECTAHFDNSANNKHNPDPAKEVRFGEQSWEEMMIGFFDIAVSPDLDAMDVVRGRRKVAAATKN
ncbi:MAG TPA: cytochrome c [Bryobacteraceae bacterium]|nr:cytochrome c [Bryobacteraceae bacterium]